MNQIGAAVSEVGDPNFVAQDNGGDEGGQKTRRLLGAPLGQPIERVYFGADLRQEGDRLTVARVLAGSPAYEQGLNTGDQIVALDNARMTLALFNARLAEKRPGDLLNLTIFRSDDLSTLLIKLGGRAEGTYRIVPLAAATEAQKKMYRSWLGVGP